MNLQELEIPEATGNITATYNTHQAVLLPRKRRAYLLQRLCRLPTRLLGLCNLRVHTETNEISTELA